MKRDKFDELLQDKLGHMEAAPPGDMWARLEAQLPEIRRSLSSEEQVPLQEALPATKIRRPLRRKMRWAYVAASFAVALTMVFSLRTLQQEAPMAGIEPVTDSVEPFVEPIADPVADKAGPEAIKRRPGTAARAVAGNMIFLEEDFDPEWLLETLKEKEEEAGYSDTEQPGSTDKGEVTAPPRGTGDTNPATVGADDEAARRLALWQESRRRKPTVSTSFYAANAAGTNNVSGNITSRTKLSNSTLVVREQDNYPDDEEYASAGGRSTSAEYKLKHDLPLSFGASVDIPLTGRLHLETGLYYTYMRSKGETIHQYTSSTMTQKLHYLGIPVKLRYDFMQTRFVDLYAAAGGSVEKMLTGKQVLKYQSESNLTDTSVKLKVGSLQGSVGLNLGAAFNIDRRWGLYVEPGVGYFFENDNQPESYRTENPFNFTVRAGVRIKL